MRFNQTLNGAVLLIKVSTQQLPVAYMKASVAENSGRTSSLLQNQRHMEGADGELPLLRENRTPDQTREENDQTIRTGSVWTAVAHIITAVIGCGVLSLAWSVAQLGWIAGPLCLLCFAAVTVVQSSLLADCYRSPDSDHGQIRNPTYMDAVKLYLGKKSLYLCGFFQQVGLYGVGIAYVITSAKSMRIIQRSICYHKQRRHMLCSCNERDYMLWFGLVQIVFSLIPTFHNMQWLSIVAAIMSFTYSSIAMALGLAKILENGCVKGSIIGVATITTTQKVSRISQAIGDIAFAYPFSIVQLEIQETLKSPPPENRTMKMASKISIMIITFFYMCCGCIGYAAFGDDTPGDILTGLGSTQLYWLIDVANACVVVHLVGGYQVFSQPVFAVVERLLSSKYPNSGFVNNYYSVRVIPFVRPYRANPLRLCLRTTYVASTAGVAMLFPQFNEVLGLLGGLGFWPLVIFLPVEMYVVQKKVRAWSRRWVVFQMLSLAGLAVSLFAVIGSVEGLVSE